MLTISNNCFKKLCNKITRTYYINQWYKQKSELLDGKLCTYFKFKNNFGMENYLSLIRNFELRRNLTRFRISSHQLRIEMGRYQGTLRQDRLCLRCASNNEVEDEIHFLFKCTKLKEDRIILIKYITKVCTNFENLNPTEKLIWLMNTENIDVLTSVCNFIILHNHPL